MALRCKTSYKYMYQRVYIDSCAYLCIFRFIGSSWCSFKPFQRIQHRKIPDYLKNTFFPYVSVQKINKLISSFFPEWRKAGLFVFNCFCNSIKDTHAVINNKTSPSALNRGVELVLQEGPLRIYWQTQNERCGRERCTEVGSQMEYGTH